MRHSAILVYPIVSVPHCGLFNRWHQLFPLAKTSFHSERIAGRAVAKSRCFGGAAARKLSEFCIKIVSGCSPLASFGRLQKVSGGKLVPTSQSSRQRGIRRFWFTLLFLCRIAAYLIVRPKSRFHEDSGVLLWTFRVHAVLLDRSCASTQVAA